MTGVHFIFAGTQGMLESYAWKSSNMNPNRSKRALPQQINRGEDCVLIARCGWGQDIGLLSFIGIVETLSHCYYLPFCGTYGGTKPEAAGGENQERGHTCQPYANRIGGPVDSRRVSGRIYVARDHI